jgi:hypothetical protein
VATPWTTRTFDQISYLDLDRSTLSPKEQIMTFRPSSPNQRPRWLVLFAILMLSLGLGASSAMAAPVFSFTPDDQGANDEPGQKDLTAQSSTIDAATGDFWTAWKWDDTSWPGGNTGDACALFDTDGDGNVNYAVCVTVANSPATETNERVYSCGDSKPDRCTQPTVLLDEDGGWCTVAPASATFPPPPSGGDLQATCNISDIADDIGVPSLNNGTLLNSCSYPSEEPNSDPSDCVLTFAPGTLTVIKVVNNNAGGTAVPSNFSYNGGGTTGLTNVTAAASPGNSHSLAAGTTFAVTEVGVVSGKITVGGVVYSVSYSGCSGTITSATTSTCTITNTADKNSPTGATTMSWVVDDSASYTIRAGAPNASSATITFKLYSEQTCTTQVGTDDQQNVTLSNAGATASANAIGYTVGVGTYYWRTFYSGDAYNNAASTACGSEVTTITQVAP